MQMGRPQLTGLKPRPEGTATSHEYINVLDELSQRRRRRSALVFGPRRLDALSFLL